MKKRSSKNAAARRFRAVNWIAATAAFGLIVYAISQMSNIAYGEAQIRVVNFSALSSKQKTRALTAANQARCTCGCGMTLAQCVATDSTCPIRDGNIDRIKVMVDAAARSTP
jgi:hypothetical protein